MAINLAMMAIEKVFPYSYFVVKGKYLYFTIYIEEVETMEMSVKERLAWWHEARYGMFIHWGLYSSLAGEWNGKKTSSIAEWIMRDLEIPIAEYEKIAKDFNPVRYDAEAWAQLAEDAGMKYLVITAKHHDGFCMFNSPSNPYNIVEKTPYGEDPMKALAEACNKRGIKMCFYYSQALDWHAEGGAGHWEEEDKANPGYPRPMEDFQSYLDDVVKPNLKELLTNYGEIGLIWFDVPMAISQKQSQSLKEYVHEFQPSCLVSGRVGHGVGDYGSLGDNEHPGGQVAGAWETPATLNDTWGFNKDDENWKSLEFVLELLVNCASKGVNYLLNVGPTDEGVIPEQSCIILKQVGAWLKTNGEAIYGTHASPFPVDEDWGRATQKENHLYLHVKKGVTEINLPGLNNKILTSQVLGEPSADLDIQVEGDITAIKVKMDCDDLYSVIHLELDGVPSVEQHVIQSGKNKIVLPIQMADLEGNIEVIPRGNTSNWVSTDNKAKCEFKAQHPGDYRVLVKTFGRRRVSGSFGNHEVEFRVAGGRSEGTVGVKDMDMSENAPGPQKPESDIGIIHISQPGTHKLEMSATKLDETASYGLSLVSVNLCPVK